MVGPGNNRGGNNNYRGNPYPQDQWQRQEPASPPRPAPAEKLPEEYADRAEQVIKKIGRQDNYDPEKLTFSLTNTKIRRLLSLMVGIVNAERLRKEPLMSQESVEGLMMARVRVAYEAGRDPEVSKFVKEAKLMEYIKGVGKDRKEFLRFARYIEALVAWHRFYGGKN